MSIDENIKRLRESRNLTQNQLGEMINVTPVHPFQRRSGYHAECDGDPQSIRGASHPRFGL